MIKWLRDDHEDARISFDERNLHDIKVFIDGPNNSAYEGGTFELDVHFPRMYPKEPPKIVFKTKIFHLNITDQGRIFLDTLTSKWDPTTSQLGDAIDNVIEMLEDGGENKDYQANDVAAMSYNDNMEEYRKEAARQTRTIANIYRYESEEKGNDARSPSDNAKKHNDDTELSHVLCCVVGCGWSCGLNWVLWL